MSRAADIEARSRTYLTPTDYDYKVSHADMAYLVEMALRAEATEDLVARMAQEKERRLRARLDAAKDRDW